MIEIAPVIEIGGQAQSFRGETVPCVPTDVAPQAPATADVEFKMAFSRRRELDFALIHFPMMAMWKSPSKPEVMGTVVTAK